MTRADWTGPAGIALQALSEADRRILLLRRVADLSLEEIAEALGLKLSAAKMRLYRAEGRFRDACRTPTGGAAPPPSEKVPDL